MTKCTHKQLMTACMLAGTLMLGACTSTPPVTKEVSIVPITNHLEETNGAFVLKSNTSIGVIDAELIPAAEYLADMLSGATGYDLKVKEGEGTITLALGDVQGKEGAYTLTAESDKVNITGNSYGGVIAGIESLRQLFPPQIESKEIVKGTDWAIPAVNIQDAPRFEWRGIMLDVSRHFYTIDEVKELLDVMALYKMNKFHWHLTDDQGWRIEIKKYPLLTEKGAWRKFNSHDRECIRQSKTDNNPDMAIPEDKIRIVEGDTLYGGYYTQEDIKDVIAYAKIRGIDIIPEIDMPGHMLAAVSNYEGVSCFNETGWGSVFSSPVCPGKDSALEFCKNIYAELIALFPYKYVHIGGDEVEKTNWKKCPDCQKRMHDNNLKTEEELQSWFIHDMERFFNGKGKEMIGWDEIIEGGLSKTATVMWWRSWVKDAATKATAQGNPVIFTPNGQFYLDYAEDKNSMASIYNLDTTDNLTPEQQSLILGVQGNIWCEWIPSNARMQYMAIPRLLAIAELGWSKPEQKDWNAFKQRLSDQFERLNIMGINYRIPDLEGFNAVNAFIGEGTINVTCLDPTAEIHYTTDGSTPTLQSPVYEGPIKVTETTDFTFCTFRPNGKKGDIAKTRFIKSEYTPSVTAAPSNPGLKATWHEFKGNKCSEIEKAPVNGTYPVEDVMIPKKVKGNIGLIPDKVIRYTCLTECATLLNVNEQIILDEIKKHLLQRDDNYLEQIKKEKDASATTSSLPPADTPFPAGSIPPADMPTLGVDDNVPPPFPPAEAEAGYQSYIPQEGREKYVFYVKEQLLLQTLIRHGEKVMCYVETEENTETPLTVIEYISMDLKQDELQFHNPLHRKILAEAEAHLHDPNFTAERYFLAHPDPTISKLAADMINDRYQLSKSNSQAMVKDEERLHELVPHQLIDFKLAILEEDMKYTLQALNKPEVVANADKCLEVMAHFKELSELQKIMAKRAGDRVVLK